MIDDGTIDGRLPTLSDDAIRQMFSQIEAHGISCIPHYISQQDLEQMQAFVSNAVASAEHEYVAFNGREAVRGTGIDDLAESEKFRSIFSRLHALASSDPAPQVKFYQVLRCLTGKGAARHSLIFHYDSYLITALIPVTIPTAGKRGDFLLLPNRRRVRAYYAANLLDKLLLDNRITQFFLRMLTRSRSSALARIELVPGNAYFFWGYRSVHTNEACDPEAVRATALFHYADPHIGSSLRARLRGHH
jgi:hypothetical protein